MTNLPVPLACPTIPLWQLVLSAATAAGRTGPRLPRGVRLQLPTNDQRRDRARHARDCHVPRHGRRAVQASRLREGGVVGGRTIGTFAFAGLAERCESLKVLRGRQVEMSASYRAARARETRSVCRTRRAQQPVDARRQATCRERSACLSRETDLPRCASLG